jgi:hypothetical protein
MICSFSHLLPTLNSHDRVKLNTCLSYKYSASQLRDEGYPISNRQMKYCRRIEAQENVMRESNINLGGRPEVAQLEIKKVEQYSLR